MLVIVPATIVLALVLVILSPLDLSIRFGIHRGRRLGPVAIWVRTIWLRWILFAHGLKVSIHGRFEAPSQRGLVVVCNHQSLLDIPIIFLLAPRDTVFLAKKELRSIPFFGWAAWIAGTQFVDRSRGARDPQLKTAVRLLQQGYSLVVFPEGTRSDDGTLLPFKKGAAVMAIESGADILPMAIEGSRDALPKKSLAIGQANLSVAIGQIISSHSYSLESRDVLTEQMAEAVSALQQQLRSLKSLPKTSQ